MLTLIPVAVQAVWRALQRRQCQRDGHTWEPYGTGHRCQRCAAEVGTEPIDLPDASGW